MTALRSIPQAIAEATPAVRRFFIGCLFLGTGAAFLEVLLTLYLQEEGLPKNRIGDILALRAVGTVLGAMVAGPLLSRQPVRRVLAGASVLAAAALVAIVEVRSDGARQAAAALFGFAITFRIVGSGPFLFRQGSERWMSMLFGIDAAILAATQVAGSALAGGAFALFRELGTGAAGAYRGALLTGACLIALSLLPYLRIEERAAVELHGEKAKHGSLPLRLALRLCVPFFLVGAGAGLTIPYLNLYFEDRFSTPAPHIAVLYAGVAATTTLGFLLSPWLARRFGLVRSVVGAELLSVPWVLVLAWSTRFDLSAAAFLIRGAFMNLPYPLYNQLIMRVVAPEQRERANAITKLAWNASWVVTAWIAGAMLERFGNNYVPTMLTTACFYVSASCSFWIFFRRTGL